MFLPKADGLFYYLWSVYKTAGWVANSVDPNQMANTIYTGSTLFKRPVWLCDCQYLGYRYGRMVKISVDYILKKIFFFFFVLFSSK